MKNKKSSTCQDSVAFLFFYDVEYNFEVEQHIVDFRGKKEDDQPDFSSCWEIVAATTHQQSVELSLNQESWPYQVEVE